MSNLNLESIVCKRYKQTSKNHFLTHTLRKKFEDNMFKIGEGETKISVTTWNESVRVHFRKFYQSKFDRKKFYPSKQGIALTLKELNDLKTLITQVDEVVDCTKIMLDDVKEERMGMNWVTDCDEMYHDEEQKKPAFERQVAVNEVETADSLETFIEEVVKEIVRLSEDTRKNKNIRLLRPEDFESNPNFAFEFQN